MFHAVLVPLDGSPLAEQALPLARRIADRAGASLHVVRVHVPAVALNGGMELMGGLQLDAMLREEERGYLSRVVAAFPTPGAPVETVLVDGPVADALQEVVTHRKVDLVVMTTHGRGRFARFWLGSVADTLVRHLSVPLLLVKPQDCGDALGQLAHLVVPLDGSPLAEQILGPARDLAQAAGAELVLLRVVEPMMPADLTQASQEMRKHGEAMLRQLSDAHTQARQAALAYLDRLADELRPGPGFAPRSSVRSSRRPPSWKPPPSRTRPWPWQPTDAAAWRACS